MENDIAYDEQDLPDFKNLAPDQIKEEFQNERNRCIALERDLFKS